MQTGPSSFKNNFTIRSWVHMYCRYTVLQYYVLVYAVYVRAQFALIAQSKILCRSGWGGWGNFGNPKITAVICGIKLLTLLSVHCTVYTCTCTVQWLIEWGPRAGIIPIWNIQMFQMFQEMFKKCFRPWIYLKYLKIFCSIEIFNKCFKYFFKYLK